ncbi:Outer membrane protein assembly factor BamB, contains PQQ-like beta-propeller repeat [Mucilaginibacter gossypiicola]|uniref:Outer membrane protein assembly factor BamB, contains PQQ-like beta-propeller repeat n=1 Tax=Mucilaginibacter gossypiicola TaxID=551995 RepID=A0A1H8UIG7_9SPHI|nr:Outer membrane protein assembly factor BamB, contains PQQ-like beta-propeller repeat [Mucilaginibacter gossypiicola]
MLNLKPYPKVALLCLLLVVLFNSCKKQVAPNPPTPDNPKNPESQTLSFKFIKFDRLDKLTDTWNNVRIYWSAAKGTAAVGVKYTVSFNGEVVAPNISDTSCYLNKVLATLPYNGKIVASSATGKIDSLNFQIPADKGFIYAGPEIGGINCYTTGGQFVWRQDIGHWLTPVISNDTVFVQAIDDITRQCSVYGLNAKTGKIIWSIPANVGYDRPVSMSYNKGIVFSTTDRDIYALKASDGSQLWHLGQSKYVIPVPRVFDDLLFCSTSEGLTYDGLLKAYNAKNGTLRWTFLAQGSSIGRATEKDNVVYITDSHVPQFTADRVVALNALDATTGQKKWRTLYLDGNVGSPGTRPLVVGNMVFISTLLDTPGAFVYAFDKNSGQLLWKAAAKYEGALAADATGLYVFENSDIMKLDLQTGRLLWSWYGPNTSLQYILTPGKIYGHVPSPFWVTGSERPFRLFDTQTGKEIVSNLPSLFQPAGQFAIVIDGVVYYLTDGDMYKFN